MEQPVLGGLGRCSCAFWLAVAFDACGLVVLLAGVFADIFFYDFLIYAGAIVIFLSLIWWVFWYTGNIEVPPEELEDDVGLQKKKEKGLTGVLRRFSSRIRSSVRTNRTISCCGYRNFTHMSLKSQRPKKEEEPQSGAEEVTELLYT
ncbi:hypothetical protein Q7C36_017679 [Tachysurus vachellii]|uniref:Transmembrane protein 238 n=1 Tax=Tachysurus vachellii TaxID=175792 RepID=A0AA88S8V7_TACVA|nr:hypothetical protein Q7C36_017679 [Tachysurus vachellii]